MIPILAVCGWIFVGIVNGLLLRSWCRFFLFSFVGISIMVYGIVIGSGIRVDAMAWVTSSLMCRSWMCWRIWRRVGRFDTWSLSSILAPSFTYFVKTFLMLFQNHTEFKVEIQFQRSIIWMWTILWYLPSARAAGTSMRLSNRLSTLTQFLCTTRNPVAIPPQWRSL